MPDSVLIIRFSALGDIAMTVPVVLSACKQYPGTHFTMLTSKMGEKIYRAVMGDTPNLTVRGVNLKKDYKGIWGLNRLFRKLKREKFDAVVDLHDVLRTKWLRFRFKLRGTPRAVIDKGRSEKKALVAHALDKQLKTSVQRYLETFEKVGLPVTIDYDARAIAERFQPHIQESEALAIGIAPFAQHAGKIYPKEQMQSVIRLLLAAEPDAHIYLFGGPDEQAELDVWASQDENHIHNIAGRQAIGDDVALMAQLDCIVTMDSANMHLASLVGTRVVSIWGATHPKAGFFGFRQQESDIISLPLDCRPCSIYGNKPCQHGDYRCLTGIQPQTIVDKVLNL